MGAFLYQWSTAAQLVSVLMIALFFVRLSRSLKRAEVLWWAQSWCWNLGAIAVTFAYWFFTPQGVLSSAIKSSYVAGKVAFALLLVQGAWAMQRTGARLFSTRALQLSVAGAAIIGVTVLGNIDLVGVAVQGVIALLFLWCGFTLLPARKGLTAWLGVGFIVRGGLALIESALYVAHLLPAGTLSPAHAEDLSFLLGAHSSIDVAAEWLLALGGVLALARRGQTELENANSDLIAAQEELRRLADRDPLTGLSNRRGLPEVFRAVYESGASLVFCDLNRFKHINDTYGHSAGDACLVRFALALRGAFRPEDSIVRYAGDEFLVVCGGLSLEMANHRVRQVRERLAEPSDTQLNISFSAGVVWLEPHGDAERALASSDVAMYADKNSAVGE